MKCPREWNWLRWDGKRQESVTQLWLRRLPLPLKGLMFTKPFYQPDFGVWWHFCCQPQGLANRDLCRRSSIISSALNEKALQVVTRGLPAALATLISQCVLRSEGLALPGCSVPQG